MEITDILKILFGAVLASGTGFLTQTFFARQNELTQRVDEITQNVWQYAELASKYWANKLSNSKAKEAEARIVAIDHFLGSMIAELAKSGAKFSEHTKIEHSLNKLSDSATGGDFQVKGRKVDANRALQIYADASELCVLLRTERRKHLRIRSLFGL